MAQWCVLWPLACRLWYLFIYFLFDGLGLGRITIEFGLQHHRTMFCLFGLLSNVESNYFWMPTSITWRAFYSSSACSRICQSLLRPCSPPCTDWQKRMCFE
jgi:hypothetical protein